MCRTILWTLAALVLVTAAAFAAPAPAAAPQAPAPVTAAQGACAPSLDFLTPGSGATCKPAAPSTAPAQPEFMASTVFHGFCRCSCTHIPDCNTSADCGGSACLRAITCC